MRLSSLRLRSVSPLLRTPITMRPPLISVIGATGTGKSQLAVDLALKYDGEIINADAMQMYSGLPVITNKITEEEKRGVVHHLMDFLGPEKVSRVGKFVKEATKTIDDIRSRGKMPIVVGGTHYYVQALLFPESILADEETPTAAVPSSEELVKKYPILDAPTPELYAHLQSVDPEIASRWHPNDRRKIRRSLEIFYSHGGKKTSEIYAEQREARAQATGTPSPYRNLIFWVHSETEVLKARLDKRVDKMLDAGLWEEIEEMDRLASTMDLETLENNAGIFQSIGFKEFKKYLQLVKEGETDPQKLEATRQEALTEMKQATRRYAKTQVRWIRVKFINALDSASEAPEEEVRPQLYLLDSTDVPAFETNVTQKAVKITEDFLAGRELPDPLSLSELAKENLSAKKWDMSRRPDLWMQKTCELCDVTTTTLPEWESHVKTGKHKKRVARVKKRREIEEFLRKRAEEKGRGESGEVAADGKSAKGEEEGVVGIKRKELRKLAALEKEAAGESPGSDA